MTVKAPNILYMYIDDSILSSSTQVSSLRKMAFETRSSPCLSLPLLFLLLASGCTLITARKLPMLGVLKAYMQRKPFEAQSSDDGFHMLNYTQTLDHFNYRPDSYATFQQRYAINFKYWGGANTSAPIFLYTGDETGLEGDLTAGFVIESAARFSALLVFIEHRYYGKSFPFGSKEEAYRNLSTLGYFSSSQALADYAELIVDLKRNLSADNCPVIAMGGSYGGMLASWFRLKYPHIVIGALASSAPILYFDDITPQDGYYSIVTKDYREAGECCYETIRQSWFQIDKIASQPNGLAALSERFNTCRPLNDTQELKHALRNLFSAYAQYDYPPQNPVSMICSGIDGAPQGTDVLGRILAGIKTLGTMSCFDIITPDDYSQLGWYWQECSEMVMPIDCNSNDTMFQEDPFDLQDFTKNCQKYYGVTPRPHWITTEFGGHNIKSVLETFGSNIIFSNGFRDPYSSGGVLRNISESIVAINTAQGAHCMDMLPSKPGDPKWLIVQRNAELEIIDGWLAQHYSSFVKGNSSRS